MKKCPFCAEQIQQEAVKCRFCGEFLDKKQDPHKNKWFFATPVVILAIACLGPLALPLVWHNPHYKVTVKVAATVIVTVLTLVFAWLLGYAYQQLMNQVKALGIN